MKGVRAVLRPAIELARTYGAKGLARRAMHETLLRSGAYAWLDGRDLGNAPPPRLLTVDTAAAARVARAYPDSARFTEQRARELLVGTYPFFTDLSLDIGWPPPWHRHPVTDVEWPPDRHWTSYAHMPPGSGDIKWIWEPARFQFAWLLPRAWCITGDQRFAVETWHGVRDWVAKNPPGHGADWFCAQELSLRCFAVLFAASVFDRDGLLSGADRLLVRDLLFTAAHRIDRTLRHGLSQRNNHAINEAVCLWTLSHVFAEASLSSVWRMRATVALRECLVDQFASDGAYIQDSLNYHRLALHSLFWARFVARSFSVELPGEVQSVLHKSWELLRGLIPPQGGQLPNYGHNDGALLLALSPSEHRDYRPTLQHLARELDAPLPFDAGPWDEARAWLGLGSGSTAPAMRPRDPLRVSSSGYLSSNRGPWMISSRIPVHREHRPAHADALHLDIWLSARNIALDPGTFSYSDAPPWNNALAETRAHNTCSVGDRSQMRRRGKFLWTHWTHGELLDQRDRDGASVWLARARCAWGTSFIHTRLVRHVAEQIDVLDAVVGGETDALRVHWNLDDVGWSRSGSAWCDSELVVSIDAQEGAEASERRGDPDSHLGWSSPTYGRKVPCTAIEVAVTGSRAWFHTVFALRGHTRAPLPDDLQAAWRRAAKIDAGP
jgi:hypothetical protein